MIAHRTGLLKTAVAALFLALPFQGADAVPDISAATRMSIPSEVSLVAGKRTPLLACDKKKNQCMSKCKRATDKSSCTFDCTFEYDWCKAFN